MCHYYDKVVIISLSVLINWKGRKKENKFEIYGKKC